MVESPAPAQPAPPQPAAPQVAEGVQRAADGTVQVALLVPLSGNAAAVGEALVNAAQLALFDSGDESFTLLVRDTGGTPQGAVAAFRSVQAEGADLVLGPLFGASARAVAPEARAAGINVVTFSNDASVGGAGVYVMGLAPTDQVQRVVSYASRQGLRRFAVLAPADPYGQLVSRAMNEAARVNAASVTRSVFYTPGAEDKTPEVRSLAPPGAGTENVGQPGYDAIMLPVGGAELLALAPLLPYYDIDPAVVKFLGTQLWDDPSLGTEPALQGGWFAAPPPDLWKNFAQRYAELYGAQPPRVASLAYDATALASVLATRAQRTNAPRVFTAEGLGQASGFAGVDGIFRFLPDGRAQRGLAVLEMQRGGFKLLDPAPRSFQDLTS